MLHCNMTRSCAFTAGACAVNLVRTMSPISQLPGQTMSEAALRPSGLDACDAPASSNIGAPLMEAAVAEARRTIEANKLQLPPELARLHLQAVDSIREAVLSTLRLMRSMSEGVDADGALTFYSAAGATALRHAALVFVQSALGMVGAAAMSDLASPSPRIRPLERDVEQSQFRTAFAGLTPQQRMVLALMCEGHANKMIAYKLGICESTVKAHVSRVLQTLKAPSRARVIALTLRYGDEDATTSPTNGSSSPI